MRYVVAVARERNFTRAAEQLHVAQQALSQQVRAVEKILGVQLFDRAARPVKLTPAGTVFVQEARDRRPVVRGADHLITGAEPQRGNQIGVGRADTGMALSPGVLVPAWSGRPRRA